MNILQMLVGSINTIYAKLMNDNHIDPKHVIVHAPYIINLANKEKIESWNFSISFLKNEIKRMNAFLCSLYFIFIHISYFFIYTL